MAGKVITVAQQKGGAGKTSLVAHLGVALQHLGRGLELPLIQQAKGWQTRKMVDGLARSHDFLLVDTPPHAETEVRIAVRAAALVLLPLQPSPMDLWATHSTLDLAISEGGKTLAVLNRLQPRPAGAG